MPCFRAVSDTTSSKFIVHFACDNSGILGTSSESLSGEIMKRLGLVLLMLCSSVSGPAPGAAQPQRWSEERANAWYQQEPWLVGSNFIPATAINELEMWQASTFDP